METGGTSNLQAKSAHIFNINIQEQKINNTYRYNSWKGRNNTKFYIDSKTIGIDNRCSACISHDKEDFIQERIKETNKKIIGFCGRKHGNIKKVTIRWNIMDDEGETHQFIIKTHTWFQREEQDSSVHNTGQKNTRNKLVTRHMSPQMMK